MVDEKTLKRGALVLGALLLVFIGFYAYLMIGGLVVGSIASTATSGTVDVSGAMNTSITAAETAYITNTASLSDNAGLIIGLVAIVVIMLVFGFKGLGQTGGKKGGVE